MTAERTTLGTHTDRIPFYFDGHRYVGRVGDTVASALLANGVRVVGRSFKYHRPRGVFGAWTEEPNAIIDVTCNGISIPNLRATTEPLVPGMSIRSVNSTPTASKDRFRLIDRFARFIPAGFYYKTFMWPDWHLFEPRIRLMAGLGRLNVVQDTLPVCRQSNLHCDLLVIGAGPAGLAAARAAAAAGKAVVLVDDQPKPGGSLLHRDAAIDGQAAADWINTCIELLKKAGGRLLKHSTAYGIYDHNLVCVWQRGFSEGDTLWRIRPKQIVLATGAIERPQVFPNNDRPGVMSAEAALVYLRRYDVLVGRRIVLATNNNRAYTVAVALRDAGADVTIADVRNSPARPSPDIKIFPSSTIQDVHGRNGVEAVTLSGERVAADCLLVSGGFTPTVHLFCQARGKLRYSGDIAAFVPDTPIHAVTVVGAANGTFDLEILLQEGHRAGGGSSGGPRPSDRDRYEISVAWPASSTKRRQWIDFQNDVTFKDVEIAARENFRSVEHLKRYTTLGMATDQGKTSNMNGIAAMAAITSKAIPEIGTTTYRPPFVPIPFPVIAGRRQGELFNPLRRLALENEHRASGALFREYGGWLRPAYYGRDGQADIHREVRQARQSVAIFDASPLGKLEVIGPDAGALIDYNSYQTISTLKSGRIRYGFLLTESGIVYDDGTTYKIDDRHYIVSCSSSHVEGVRWRLEEWRQDRFDPSKVFIHNSTPQWVTLTASGPMSKTLVSRLDLRIDLADDVFPHMSHTLGEFDGAPARIARVSFTGDRSYEISVPTSRAGELWNAMISLGAEVDAVLLGTEALFILRAEKGYLITGKDTDGTTMPHDLGVAGPRASRKAEFVGKRSLFSEVASEPNRRHLVGLSVSPKEGLLPTGAHAIELSGSMTRSIGFVTSSYFSPSLGKPIALALIENGLHRIGERISVVHLSTRRNATISQPCAYDPEGAALNA